MLAAKTILYQEKSFGIALLLGAILLILCIQVFFIFNFNINWDEFLYLSIIYEYSWGTLSKSLQTFHVHFFTWVTHLDWDEVQLILLNRTFMLGCELLTLGFIYLISRRFVSANFALIGVVSYLASGYVLTYGTSFRADPIITALLMASIYLLMDRSGYIWRCLGASITVAVATLISIKSVFYFPPLFAALVWRTRDTGAMKNKLSIYIGFALSASITTLVLYFWHRSGLSTGGTNASIKLDSVFTKVFVEAPFWPRKDYFLSWISVSWPQMLLILAGLSLMWMRHKRQSNVLLIVSVLFTLPIFCTFFYRNAFPYFYPFIVAPSMIAVSIGVQEIWENVSRKIAISLITIVLIYMVNNIVDQAHLYSYRNQTGQREVVSAIHTMFAEPTPYIDNNSMISSYPKCGFFMSSWGTENYRRRGKPVFEQVLKECEPKFLIANSYKLSSALNSKSSETAPRALFDKDAEVLRANFIHHWGKIWVAGKSFRPSILPETFDIVIEGTYTVESSEPIVLDGQQYSDGDVVFLSTGSHVMGSSGHQVSLRFGDHLYRPDFVPTSRVYFGFL
jgi:hypothetical protein